MTRGWKNESERHSLSAKGIKTGRKSSGKVFMAGGKMNEWEVILNGRVINVVFYDVDVDREYVKESLIAHDGYPNNIWVRRR